MTSILFHVVDVRPAKPYAEIRGYRPGSNAIEGYPCLDEVAAELSALGPGPVMLRYGKDGVVFEFGRYPP